MAAKAKAEETRTLLVVDSTGQFRLTVPAAWKITFGAFQTGKYGGGGDSALRIYEAENKQRACFVNVRSFRDLDLPIERLVISEQGESSWTRDEGGMTETKSIQRTKSWESE